MMRPAFLRRVIRRFVDDRRGSLSIEMVIVIPLLLFLTTGGLTFWNAFNSNSRTAKVAYTVADIMSRHEVVSGSKMAVIKGVADKMLPANVVDRTLSISSICLQNDGAYHVLWSQPYPEETLSVLEAEDVPAEIMPTMAPQDSVILVELSGSWSPQFLNVGIKPMRWNNAIVNRPRFVKYIPHSDKNPDNFCPSD